MGISVSKASVKGFNKATERLIAEAEYLTLRAFADLGERCVRMVRDRSGDESWYDDTGNLRSSVGYVISRDGRIISASAFNQVKRGASGVKEGKALAEELARAHRSGYALVIVAGMNYAEYVEERPTKDVLENTRRWANAEAPKMMAKLKAQVARLVDHA